MKIAVCQLNFTIGNFEATIAKIRDATRHAAQQGADLAVTSELSIWGYPAQDILLQPYLLNRAKEMINQLANDLKDCCPLIVGSAVVQTAGYHLPYYNAGLLLHQGTVTTVTTKKYLPYYDVFDEPRYFTPGDGPAMFEVNGRRIVLSVCEDMWQSKEFNISLNDPIEGNDFDGFDADLIINISASPFFSGKPQIRDLFLQKFAAQFRKKVLFVNQVGAHDHIIFDGNSRFLNEEGHICAVLKAFQEQVKIIDTDALSQSPPEIGRINPESLLQPFDPESVYQALCLGLQDYCAKNGISRVCVGVSGGIDSAVVLSIAVGALGADAVTAVTMPSEFNSAETKADAFRLIDNLGLTPLTLPITDVKNVYLSALSGAFGEEPNATVQENIQSRIRGTLLMSVANQSGAIVLATGNKSEIATGYCTIYGDTNGALAVIGDLWKTQVYQLADYINRDVEVIPESIITRLPSAELRLNQKDSDSLPEYTLLDDLLNKMVCRLKTPEELIREGFQVSAVRRVAHLLRTSEFKRKQLPPVLKVSERDFTSGRRMTVSSAV